jgi:hypothetical protein
VLVLAVDESVVELLSSAELVLVAAVRGAASAVLDFPFVIDVSSFAAGELSFTELVESSFVVVVFVVVAVAVASAASAEVALLEKVEAEEEEESSR